MMICIHADVSDIFLKLSSLNVAGVDSIYSVAKQKHILIHFHVYYRHKIVIYIIKW